MGKSIKSRPREAIGHLELYTVVSSRENPKACL